MINRVQIYGSAGSYNLDIGSTHWLKYNAKSFDTCCTQKMDEVKNDGGYRSILDRGSDIFFSNTTGILSVVPMHENFHTFQNSKSNS
jgi:hypothetical protein